MRTLAAFVIAGVSLAVALFIHRYGHDFTYRCTRDGNPFGACSGRTHPSWVDPVAIVVAFVGVGAAAAVFRRRDAA